MTVDLDNRHRRIIYESNVADPLALHLILELPIDLSQRRLLRVEIHCVMLLLRCYNDQVNI